MFTIIQRHSQRIVHPNLTMQQSLHHLQSILNLKVWFFHSLSLIETSYTYQSFYNFHLNSGYWSKSSRSDETSWKYHFQSIFNSTNVINSIYRSWWLWTIANTTESSFYSSYVIPVISNCSTLYDDNDAVDEFLV